MPASEILVKVGTQISFADHANDFAPATGSSLEQGTPTDVQIQMASVANDAARQSVQVDLGATRARSYSVVAAFEMASTGLTAGQALVLYWAPSPDATAANGNPAGVSGADAAYAGYSSNLDDSLKQLQRIGSAIVTGQATTTVQIAFIGILVPTERYGSLVVVDRSGAAFHSDDVETHIVMNPNIDEAQ